MFNQMTQIYGETIERVQSYHPFAEDIVDCVAQVASLQASMDFGQFKSLFGVPEPQMVAIEGAKPLGVLDIIPKNNPEPHKARVMHLGMGNGLLKGNNQAYQVATVFAADPTVRTIAFGNPGGPGRREGLLSAKDAWKVARGNTRPLVDGPMRYLASHGITHTEQDGYSFGTVPAISSAKYAELYDHKVTQITAIEPADVNFRGRKLPAMKSLGQDFAESGGSLKSYVDANGLEAFIEARGDSVLGMASYILGLFRINNLARTSTMANNLHESRSQDALVAQPDARMHTIWGSESELATDMAMNLLTTWLRVQFRNRYASTRLEGQKHTMVNDLALQSALLLHARRA